MNRKPSSSGILLWLALLAGINVLAYFMPWRLDLTQEKRFTLSRPTRQLLGGLGGEVRIDVFLAGKLNAGLRKLQKSTQNLLGDFNRYSNGRLDIRFYDPLAKLDDSTAAALLDSLKRMDIEPMTQVAQSQQGGEESQRIVLPAAIVRFGNRVFPVNLLKGVQAAGEGQPAEQIYTNAETQLEFKFADAINHLTRKEVPEVGYLLGNGEPLDFSVFDLIEYLRGNYQFNRNCLVQLDSVPFISSELSALVVVKPTHGFSDAEKLKLDQYLMRGGNIIWMVDVLHAEMDSLRMDQQTLAYDRGLNLEDLFFKSYGIRVNEDLVEDLQCARLNFVVGMQGDKPQIQLLNWPYFPLLEGSLTHPISKNLDPVYSKFANSIDTVKAEGIQKTILLHTSDNSRIIGTPAIISFESLKRGPDSRLFTHSNIPVGMLLEGRFSSLFENRISAATADTLARIYKQPYLSRGQQASKVIVCSDAEMFLNEVTDRGPLPLGMDRDISFTFANKDFMQNCVAFLVDRSGILATRSKEFTLRLLDPRKVEQNRGFWQFVNIAAPILLVILAGIAYQGFRRRRYQ
jgi:ABC-2 type transport system permease protein